MKRFNNFILSKSRNDNSFLLIPQPYVNDIYNIIQEFNEENNKIKYGFIHMDLQIIVGNRKKKYVSYEISDYKIIRNSKMVFSDVSIQNELQDLKSKFYKQLHVKTLKNLLILNSEQPLF